MSNVTSHGNPPQSSILVVEDEELVRAYVNLVLQGDGYDVLESKDGLDAVNVFEAAQERIGLVILDLTLPKLKGLDVAAKMRTLRPTVPIILMSGSHDVDMAQHATQPHLTTFLPKPFRPDDLLKLVKKMTAG